MIGLVVALFSGRLRYREFLIGSRAASWRCKKQSCIATFSWDADYISSFSTSEELIWLSRLLASILDKDTVPPITLHVVNQCSIHNTKGSAINHCNRHIDIRCHFVHDAVRSLILMTAEYICMWTTDWPIIYFLWLINFHMMRPGELLNLYDSGKGEFWIIPKFINTLVCVPQIWTFKFIFILIYVEFHCSKVQSSKYVYKCTLCHLHDTSWILIACHLMRWWRV